MNFSRQLSPALAISLPERSTFLLPALSVWASLAIYLGSRKQSLGIVSLIATMESKPLVVLVGLTLVGIFTVFVLGHVVDLLSQLIYERLLADKLDGFPHERIVPISQTTGNYRRFVKRKRTNLRRPTFFFEGAKLLISSVVLTNINEDIPRRSMLYGCQSQNPDSLNIKKRRQCDPTQVVKQSELSGSGMNAAGRKGESGKFPQ
ncbi:MAG: hypothetical protein Q7T44_17595, partial [Parvibaculum sp.]|nr:hypothetical protein [Parvibaculum sp.]